MELPADVDYVEDVNLFIWQPRGVLSEALVNRIIVFVRKQEETLGRSFNRFTDLSALDAVDLNFDYVFHIALYRRLSYAEAKVKSAFYVSSSDAAHYAKLHALVTDHSPLQVSIFTKLGSGGEMAWCSQEGSGCAEFVLGRLVRGEEDSASI